MHEHGDLLQCFVVSTLVSMTPANPFIFRTYELSPGSTERARQVCPKPKPSPLCLPHSALEQQALHIKLMRPNAGSIDWAAHVSWGGIGRMPNA